MLQRQQIADALARYMAQLGLERRRPDVPSLQDYIAKRYARADEIPHSAQDERSAAGPDRCAGSQRQRRARRHGGHDASIRTHTRELGLALREKGANTCRSTRTQDGAELEQLEARRRQLAFEVGQGRDELEPELDAVEDQIARITRSRERATLAEQERAVRAKAETRAQAEAARQQMEDRLAELVDVRLTAARHVEAAMRELEVALAAYLQSGAEMYSVSAGLGKARPRLAGVEQLAGFISWRLHSHLPHDFPRPLEHARRRALVEMLGGEAVSQPEPEPAKGKRGARH